MAARAPAIAVRPREALPEIPARPLTTASSPLQRRMPKRRPPPQTLAEISSAIARLEAMIDSQRRLADRLRDAGFDPVETLRLVGHLERRLAQMRARRGRANQSTPDAFRGKSRESSCP